MKILKYLIILLLIHWKIFTNETVFTQIFLQNTWGSNESISGTGSTLAQTQVLRADLAKLIKDYNIKSILDVPCGDFNWMQYVNLDGISYIGCDIVKPLIDKNNRLYSKANRKFLHANALTDSLPQVDLIICRDMLVHLSFNDCVKVLRNFKRCKSKYILITTFSWSSRINVDINTGSWRPLNMEKNPFNFIPSMYLLNENCTEVNGIYIDKSLGLWRLQDISI